MNRILLLLVFCLFSFESSAQNIRLSFKVILDHNDGSRPDYATETLFDNSIIAMNSLMRANGSSYTFSREATIEIGGLASSISSTYDTLSPSNATATTLEAAAEGNPSAYGWRENRINVYFNNGGNTGYCSLPDSDREIIMIGEMTADGDRLLHEIGHFFSLYHTQGQICSNCESDSTGVCHTEPGDDGIASTLEDLACWSRADIAFNAFGSGVLIKSEENQVDSTFHNIMSYHSSRKYFTSEQLDKWEGAIIGDRADVVSNFSINTDQILLQDTKALNIGAFFSRASITHDFDNDGDLDIIASKSKSIYMFENVGNKQFLPVELIVEDINFHISDIDVVDIDGDQDMDYVVCFYGTGSTGELAWFERLGNDTFRKWVISDIGFADVDIADFDNDGDPDIIGAGSDGTGRLYLNQLAQTFFEQIIADNGIQSSVDANDIDNDGDVDVAFGGSGTVHADTNQGSRLLLNDGNANFSFGGLLHCYANNYNDCGRKDIEIIDLNNDGIKDIIATSTLGSGGIYFLDGNNGYARTKISSELGSDFVIFDVDQNGLLDIVIQNYLRERVSVLYQYSGFVFEREIIELHWDGGSASPNMSFGDFDNDGDEDLVLPGSGSLDISWFENIDGKLYKHLLYGELAGVRIPKLVDLDNDGDLDIFATVSYGSEEEVVLYENLDGYNFISWRIHDDIDGPTDMDIADIDKDGDLDIFVTARHSNNLIWLRNDGLKYDWVADTIYDAGIEPIGLASSDIDDDGDQDVIMCAYDGNEILGFFNDGNGNFTQFIVDNTIVNPIEVEVVDIDNDGDKDVIAIAQTQQNSVILYKNNGNENFIKKIIYENECDIDELVNDLEIGDWNNDGALDILAGFIGDGAGVRCFLKDPSSDNYIAKDLRKIRSNVGSIKLINLDNDGDLDIVTGHLNYTNNNTDYIVYGAIQENGSIANTIPLSPLSGINTIAYRGRVYGIDIGDINNDNKKDIVYTDHLNSNLSLSYVDAVNCPIVRDIPNDISSGFLPASNTVYGSQPLDIGLDLDVQAGQCIELRGGFRIPKQTDFDAKIGPCIPFDDGGGSTR